MIKVAALLAIIFLVYHFPRYGGSNVSNGAFFCWELARLLDGNESIRINVAILFDDAVGKIIQDALFQCSLDMYLIKVNHVQSNVSNPIVVRNVVSSLPSLHPSICDGVYDVPSAVKALVHAQISTHHENDDRNRIEIAAVDLMSSVTWSSENSLSTFLPQELYLKRLEMYNNTLLPSLLQSIMNYDNNQRDHFQGWKKKQISFYSLQAPAFSLPMDITKNAQFDLSKRNVEKLCKIQATYARDNAVNINRARNYPWTELYLNISCPLVVATSSPSTRTTLYSFKAHTESQCMYISHTLRILDLSFEEKIIPVSGTGRRMMLEDLRRQLIESHRHLLAKQQLVKIKNKRNELNFHCLAAIQDINMVVLSIDNILGNVDKEAISSAEHGRIPQPFMLAVMSGEEKYLSDERRWRGIRKYYETVSQGISVICPSMYLFIRCQRHERDMIDSYMHNTVIMQLVRSTSDHIAWIFLDHENVVDDDGEQESWASMLDDHYMTIKEYAEAYLSIEDIAIMVPSYQALLRINIPKLQHQMMERADGSTESYLNLPSAVILEIPKYHYTAVNRVVTDTLPADAGNAVFFGYIIRHLLSHALSMGLFHEAYRPRSFSNRPKFYRVVNDFFKHLHMTPYWDTDVYFERIEGKQFRHMQNSRLRLSDFDSSVFLRSMREKSSEHSYVETRVAREILMSMLIDNDSVDITANQEEMRWVENGIINLTCKSPIFSSVSKEREEMQLATSSITNSFTKALVLWYVCGDSYIFKLINALPRVIFIRKGVIARLGDVSFRLDELMSTYNTIHDKLVGSSVGISFWYKGERYTVLSLHHHATARHYHNNQLLRRKFEELNSLILYYMGDIQGMYAKILQSVNQKIPYNNHSEVISNKGWINQDDIDTTRWMDVERNKYQYWLSAGTHFVAVATEERPELQALREMAEFAGLDLQVIGLGNQDFSWKNKLKWVLDHLKSRLIDDDQENTVCSERHAPGNVGDWYICKSDVVVVTDAYDVGLTLSARLIGRHLYESPTPLIFCGEVAAFPNYAYAYLYPHQEGRNNQFLNAGCFFGPASYIIESLEDILGLNSIIQMSDTESDNQIEVVLADDQYEWARYYFEHPHLIRVDSAQNIMMCVFRSALSVDMSWIGGIGVDKLTLPDEPDLRQRKYPAIIHFNADIKVKFKMMVFDYYLPSIKQVKEAITVDGKHCLRDIWTFWDQIYELFVNDTERQTVHRQLDAANHQYTWNTLCVVSQSAHGFHLKTKACRDFHLCTNTS